MITLSLVLPVHNEEAVVEKAVIDIAKVLDKNKINYELILVENGSRDKSLDVIKKMAQKNKRFKVLIAKKGYGSAILAGLKEAKGEYAGYIDSDGQDDAEAIPLLLNKLEEGKADLAKGKRKTRESLKRLIISRCFNLITNILFPIGDWDINAKPKIWHKKWTKIFNLKSKDSFICPELMIKAKKLHLRVWEIPVNNYARDDSNSTFGMCTIMEFVINLIKYRFRYKK